MRKVLEFVILIFVFFGFIWTLGAITDPIHGQKNPVSRPTYPNPDKLTSLVNSWRNQNGLQTFTKNEVLCGLASSRSVDIQTDWSHDKFVPDIRARFLWGYFGENLAKGYSDEQELLDAWLASPEHRANLENKTYTQMCIACQRDYCAQEFESAP